MLKEAAFGIGCTSWEVMRRIVVPYTRVGVIGGVMLALGRALGETMAVTFVIGNAHKISPSLLAPGTTISATIANEFTEAVGELYTSSLIALGLILFVITFIVLAFARLHADAHRTTGSALMTSADCAQGAFLQTARKLRNAIAMGLCWASTVFGLLALALILGALLWNGFAGLSLDVFTKMTPPPGQRGRPAQRDCRLADHDRSRRADRRAARPAGRHLHGRIWPLSKLATVVRFINDILLQRALDRHRPVRL